MQPIGCEGVMGLHSAGDVLYLRLLCLYSEFGCCRIHPLNVLLSLKAYEKGKPATSSKMQWKVNPDVAAALDRAFYKSFKVIEMARTFHYNNTELCPEKKTDKDRILSVESLTGLESGRMSSCVRVLYPSFIRIKRAAG